MKFNSKTKKIESKLRECFSGSELYATLYELKIHPTELLDINKISMFRLEQLAQSRKSIYLTSDKWEEIAITFYAGKVQTIPNISMMDSHYPSDYNGYALISV